MGTEPLMAKRFTRSIAQHHAAGNGLQMRRALCLPRRPFPSSAPRTLPAALNACARTHDRGAPEQVTTRPTTTPHRMKEANRKKTPAVEAAMQFQLNCCGV
eukprot:2509157-Pleurochrysis_carterae.AAC.1